MGAAPIGLGEGGGDDFEVVFGSIGIAFVAVLVLPGHVDPADGFSGPLLWAIAAIASTAAIRRTARR
ncbi:MAG TPA: hypothetical protein VFU12_00340 [Glycomyces sp.]|nr:hypothetical protein [Glycomyces sp.]